MGDGIPLLSLSAASLALCLSDRTLFFLALDALPVVGGLLRGCFWTAVVIKRSSNGLSDGKFDCDDL